MVTSWEKTLRCLIKGTTQVTRRWLDDSRRSATVRIPWRRASGPQLLALIERLEAAIALSLREGSG